MQTASNYLDQKKFDMQLGYLGKLRGFFFSFSYKKLVFI